MPGTRAGDTSDRNLDTGTEENELAYRGPESRLAGWPGLLTKR